MKKIQVPILKVNLVLSKEDLQGIIRDTKLPMPFTQDGKHMGTIVAMDIKSSGHVMATIELFDECVSEYFSSRRKMQSNSGDFHC